nr:MFS transporter [uncultured Clostridium sp.]
MGSVNIASGLNVASYYFLYIVKNVEISGVISIFSIVAMLTMALFPVLLKRISTAQLVRFSLSLSLLSGIILFIAKDNLVLLSIGMIITGIVSLPSSFLSNILIVECADYNEWKGMPRMEGTLSSVTNFAVKIGQALGTFLVGILLTAAGFNGRLDIQPDSAIMMIRLCYSFIPAVIFFLAAFAMHFYNLDKLKQEMEKDLEERREKINKTVEEA